MANKHLIEQIEDSLNETANMRVGDFAESDPHGFGKVHRARVALKKAKKALEEEQ